eukprot:gene23422-24868_t
MTVLYADFIAAFPEFSDATAFPASQINFWLAQAPNNLNARRLGKNYDLATMLYVAHNVVISAREVASAEKGIPGTAPGLISSKTVGPVSVSYDAAGTAVEGAGAWNATSYGQRLYKMLQAMKSKTANVNALVERIKAMTKSEVLVGIPDQNAPRSADEDEARKASGEPVNNAELGYIHEFGVPEQNIPARPFLIPGITAVKARLATILGNGVRKTLSGDGAAAEQ